MCVEATGIRSTTFERVELELETAFTIARETQTETTNHVVTVTDEEGRFGLGGAAPSSYYGETPESVESALPALLRTVEAVNDPFAQQMLEERFEEVAPDEAAARAAVSIAVHDLTARQCEEPLYRQWGLDSHRVPQTSYTVGIAAPEEMADRAKTAVDAGFSTLKIKLGTDTDRQRLTAVREAVPGATLRVDANCDWEVETALDNLDWLETLDVQLLEQPVPRNDLEGLGEIARASDIPVAADESCITAREVPRVADVVDIVVVKLMKCGGIRPAIRQIETAKAHGLDVMLGCMVESNASIAGACHLAPLVKYADLDGSLLLAQDPWSGPVLQDGRIALAESDRGIGVSTA